MIKGLWLFGISGSGKTYLSKKTSKKIKKPFIIDGDEIRKFISFDLGYKNLIELKTKKSFLNIDNNVIRSLNEQFN